MNKKTQEKVDTNWSLSFRYVVAIISFAAIVAFLFYAGDAIRNLVVAGFVAYLINPIVVYLANHTRLTRTASVLKATVEDNGRGFDVGAAMDPYRPGAGAGLLGMRERVEMVSGTFAIESAPGQGTTVTARVPFRNGARESKRT